MNTNNKMWLATFILLGGVCLITFNPEEGASLMSHLGNGLTTISLLVYLWAIATSSSGPRSAAPGLGNSNEYGIAALVCAVVAGCGFYEWTQYGWIVWSVWPFIVVFGLGFLGYAYMALTTKH
jgi:hypothetical protein